MVHLHSMSQLMDEHASELRRITEFVDIDAFSLGIVDIFSLAEFFSPGLSRGVIRIDIEF